MLSKALQSPIRTPANAELEVRQRIGYSIFGSNSDVIAILWLLDLGKELPDSEIREYCAALGQLLEQRSYLQSGKGRETPTAFVHRKLSGERLINENILPWTPQTPLEFMVLVFYGNSMKDLRLSTQSVFQRFPILLGNQDVKLITRTTINNLDTAVYGFSKENSENVSTATTRFSDRTHEGWSGEAEATGFGISEPGGPINLRSMYIDAALAAFLSRHLHRRSPMLRISTVTSMAKSICAPVTQLETPPLERLKATFSDPDDFVYETVAALLHTDGTPVRVAAALHIHRTTLHYRINQIEHRTGLNLRTPADMMQAANVWLRVTAQRSRIGPLLQEGYRKNDGTQ